MVDHSADAPRPTGATGPAPGRRGKRDRHLDLDTLNAVIDDTLSPADLAAARDHLARCPECRRDLAELRATKDMLAALPTYAPARSFTLGPEHARRGPVAAVLPPPTSLRWFPRARAMQIAMAAVAALLLISIAGDLLTRQTGSMTLPAAQSGTVMNAATEDRASDAPAVFAVATNQAEAPVPAAAPPAMKASGGAEPAREIAPEPAAVQGQSALTETGTVSPAPSLEQAEEPAPAAAANPPVSPWRIAELGFGLLLLWLIVSHVGLNWLRRHNE